MEDKDVSRRKFLTGCGAWATLGIATFGAGIYDILSGNPIIQSIDVNDAMAFNSTEKYGFLSADDPLARYAKAYLNGVDVSSYCSAADDIEGWVELYAINPDGKIQAPIRTMRVYGRVIIELEIPS